MCGAKKTSKATLLSTCHSLSHSLRLSHIHPHACVFDDDMNVLELDMTVCVFIYKQVLEL